MCDGDIDRHIDLVAAFFIPAHDNDGEVCRLSVRDAAAAAGKRRPRRTGYAVEIRRLIRLGLDALDIGIPPLPCSALYEPDFSGRTPIMTHF